MNTLPRLAAAAATAIAIVLPTVASSARADTTPATAGTLSASPAVQPVVTCDANVGDGRKTVLLVHGTATNAQETWSWNWERSLPLIGYGVCSIDLPNRELTNLVGSADYVAAAARIVYAKSGRKISLLGHSQGGTLVTWVAKFFPEVAARTDDVISLAGDFGGTALLTPTCLDGACPDISWQLSLGSRHLEALVRAPFPTGPSFTSIYSTGDEVVFPQPTGSTLPGASNASLQDVCGVRPIEHGGILADSVAYTLVKDALDNAGPTRLSRIPLTTRLAACASVQQPGADPLGYVNFVPTILSLTHGLALGGQPDAPSEPALPAYAERFAS